MSQHTRWMVWAAFAVLGCEPSASPVDVGDASPPRRDGSIETPVCTSDEACADDLYCNGAERCAPEDPSADARGCLPASEPPCIVGRQHCSEEEDRCLTDCEVEDDADDDGSDAIECGGDDCDDADGDRFPGNPEVCDAADHDEDCDLETYGFRDGDGDDVGDERCCNRDGAISYCGSDCNDAARGVHPDAPEVCNERDDDCNGEIDEGVSVDLYPDADGDHFGDEDAVPMLGCPERVDGYVADATDCDDAITSIHPGREDDCSTSGVDDDCDGEPEDGCTCVPGETRACSDRLGVCASGSEICEGRYWGECDTVPELFERCDGRDEDCNGVIDDRLRGTCWTDVDRDGYASDSATSSEECLVGGACPGGFTASAPSGDSIDCDDTRSARSPANTEVCNALRIDEDCDGAVDEGVSVICYADGDNDGFAASGTGAATHCPDPSRTLYGLCPVNTTDRAPVALVNTDCDDSMGGVRPGGVETCNGIDDNCNGTIDDGTQVLCYADGDDDGYTIAGATSMMLCRDPSRPLRGHCPAGWTFRSPSVIAERDCADGDPSRYPGAIEECDAIDQDCDGSAEDVTMVACYADTDNDSWAAMGALLDNECPAPGRAHVGDCPLGFTNRAPTATVYDCAPGDISMHPGVVEVCDGTDRNCNSADEGTVACYRDADEDGRAPEGTPATMLCPAPDGRCDDGYTRLVPTRPQADCNDSNPARTEPPITCYPDGDRDSYPSTLDVSTIECPVGVGYGGCASARTIRTSIDCCDGEPLAHPGRFDDFATPRRVCGGYDYDCSGTEERSSPSLASGTCSAPNPATCVARPYTPGWLGAVPGCGEHGSYATGCEWGFIDEPGGTARCLVTTVPDGSIQLCR
jgi:hypothetical protein